MWQRKINPCLTVTEPGLDVPEETEDMGGWLARQAAERPDLGLAWLLAHADDGVVWGRIEGDKCVTARDAAERTGDAGLRAQALAVCPRLRTGTLQQARLFGSGGELLLWRDGDRRFHARLIRNAGPGETPTFGEAYDERTMLWGTGGIDLAGGFSLWTDGAQGLRHALPFAVGAGRAGPVRAGTGPPRLVVRHVLTLTGFARVVASRLVGFDGVAVPAAPVPDVA